MNLLPSHHHHDFLHHEPLWALLSLSRISLCASPDTPTYANNPLFIESSQSIEHKPGSELQHQKYSVLPPFKNPISFTAENCSHPSRTASLSQPRILPSSRLHNASHKSHPFRRSFAFSSRLRVAVQLSSFCHPLPPFSPSNEAQPVFSSSMAWLWVFITSCWQRTCCAVEPNVVRNVDRRRWWSEAGCGTPRKMRARAVVSPWWS